MLLSLMRKLSRTAQLKPTANSKEKNLSLRRPNLEPEITVTPKNHKEKILENLIVIKDPPDNPEEKPKITKEPDNLELMFPEKNLILSLQET